MDLKKIAPKKEAILSHSNIYYEFHLTKKPIYLYKL